MPQRPCRSRNRVTVSTAASSSPLLTCRAAEDASLVGGMEAVADGGTEEGAAADLDGGVEVGRRTWSTSEDPSTCSRDMGESSRAGAGQGMERAALHREGARCGGMQACLMSARTLSTLSNPAIGAPRASTRGDAPTLVTMSPRRSLGSTSSRSPAAPCPQYVAGKEGGTASVEAILVTTIPAALAPTAKPKRAW